MPKNAYTPSWLKFFKPKNDFFALLTEQAQTTLDGLRGLQECISTGGKSGCKAVHELEHKADDQKLDIELKLRDTFVTPFDREEIYDLSASLDLIINEAKRTVKDVEFCREFPMNDFLLRMSDLVVKGAEDLVNAFEHLNKDLEHVTESANKARKTLPHVGKVYREALVDLMQQEDIAVRVQNKHFYDCLHVIAERIERLGELLLHISIKLG